MALSFPILLPTTQHMQTWWRPLNAPKFKMFHESVPQSLQFHCLIVCFLMNKHFPLRHFNQVFLPQCRCYPGWSAWFQCCYCQSLKTSTKVKKNKLLQRYSSFPSKHRDDDDDDEKLCLLCSVPSCEVTLKMLAVCCSVCFTVSALFSFLLYFTKKTPLFKKNV